MNQTPYILQFTLFIFFTFLLNPFLHYLTVLIGDVEALGKSGKMHQKADPSAPYPTGNRSSYNFGMVSSQSTTPAMTLSPFDTPFNRSIMGSFDSLHRLPNGTEGGERILSTYTSQHQPWSNDTSLHQPSMDTSTVSVSPYETSIHAGMDKGSESDEMEDGGGRRGHTTHNLPPPPPPSSSRFQKLASWSSQMIPRRSNLFGQRASITTATTNNNNNNTSDSNNGTYNTSDALVSSLSSGINKLEGYHTVGGDRTPPVDDTSVSGQSSWEFNDLEHQYLKKPHRPSVFRAPGEALRSDVPPDDIPDCSYNSNGYDPDLMGINTITTSIATSMIQGSVHEMDDGINAEDGMGLLGVPPRVSGGGRELTSRTSEDLSRLSYEQSMTIHCAGDKHTTIP